MRRPKDMEGGQANALVAQAAGGDARAFAALVEEHYAMVYAIAYKWSGARADAEDIAQESFIKLGTVIGSFQYKSSFKTWLYRLVVNTAKDYFRKSNRVARNELPFAEGFDAPSAESSAEDRMLAAETYRAIHALPEDIRDTVLLVYAEEMSHRDAAAVLGCAEATVAWRVFQARKLLKLRSQQEGKTYG